MEVIAFIGVLSWLGIAVLVGWLTDQRGQGFVLGFFVSLIASPLIGILVAIALGDKKSAAGVGSRPSSSPQVPTGPAHAAWEAISDSLEMHDYDDFLVAFAGHTPALQAARHKRQLLEWKGTDQLNTEAIERMLNSDPFPALYAQIRKQLDIQAEKDPSILNLAERLRNHERQQMQALEQAENAKIAEGLRLQTLAREQEVKDIEVSKKRFVLIIVCTVVIVVLLVVCIALIAT